MKRLASSILALAVLLATATAAGTPVAGTSVAGAPAAGNPVARAGAAYADWPTYHGNALRSGYAPSMPAARGAPRVTSRLALDGAVYGSPIVIGGRAIVATENDTVYAIQDGRVLWRRHLGTPAPSAQLPCGNIFPLGITGTPVYSDGVVYVAAEYGGPPRHQLVALRFSTGAVLWRRDLDLGGVERSAMQERGALAVAGGRVWVPFGGLDGDCGGYKGRLIGVPANGSGSAVAYTVPTAREAGMWAPPGPAFDGRDLYVSVGNGAAGVGSRYDGSDSILKLSTSARRLGLFAPRRWATDNDSDLDLGSQGAAIVGKWIFADGKSGTAYVLRRAHLGGIGGEVSSAPVCHSYGGTAVVGSRVYVPCDDGVRAVRIDARGRLHVVWQASIAGSPVVGGGRVWSLDPGGGRLYALNPATGGVVTSVAVGTASRFATPAIYGPRLYVPTLSGLVVVTSS